MAIDEAPSAVVWDDGEVVCDVVRALDAYLNDTMSRSDLHRVLVGHADAVTAKHWGLYSRLGQLASIVGGVSDFSPDTQRALIRAAAESFVE